MLITDKGNLEVKRAFCYREKKNNREKQSKTNRRAVGLDTAFYSVYTIVYKSLYFIEI